MFVSATETGVLLAARAILGVQINSVDGTVRVFFYFYDLDSGEEMSASEFTLDCKLYDGSSGSVYAIPYTTD